MTPEQWLASPNPKAMLEAAQARITPRQARFLHLAFCEQAQPLMKNERVQRGLAFLQKHVEHGLERRRGRRQHIDDTELAVRQTYAGSTQNESVPEQQRRRVQHMLAWLVHCALVCRVGGLIHSSELAAQSVGWTWGMDHVREGVSDEQRRTAWGAAVEQAELAQAEMIREIVGNPFRPVTFEPAWRTSTVLALAQGIYDERAFDRMPILADALQDAGCEHTDILNHCRDEKAGHIRGCWVVDMVLDKK
jgi:hypothetical protein